MLPYPSLQNFLETHYEEVAAYRKILFAEFGRVDDDHPLFEKRIAALPLLWATDAANPASERSLVHCPLTRHMKEQQDWQLAHLLSLAPCFVFRPSLVSDSLLAGAFFASRAGKSLPKVKTTNKPVTLRMPEACHLPEDCAVILGFSFVTQGELFLLDGWQLLRAAEWKAYSSVAGVHAQTSWLFRYADALSRYPAHDREAVALRVQSIRHTEIH